MPKYRPTVAILVALGALLGAVGCGGGGSSNTAANGQPAVRGYTDYSIRLNQAACDSLKTALTF